MGNDSLPVVSFPIGITEDAKRLKKDIFSLSHYNHKQRVKTKLWRRNRGEKVWQKLLEIAAREQNQHSSPTGSKITMQKLGILKLKVECCDVSATASVSATANIWPGSKVWGIASRNVHRESLQSSWLGSLSCKTLQPNNCFWHWCEP